jgi:opacity protein-like surface antigen
MTFGPAARSGVLVLSMLMAMVGCTSGVHAQGFVSPLIGYNFGGDAGCPTIDNCDDKNLNVGLALGAMGNVVGFEQEFAYARDFFGDAPALSSSVLTIMSNLMINPKIGPIRPYVLIGMGLMKTRTALTTAQITETDNNHLGWDVGGGLMVFFGGHVGIRGDIRYFHAFEDLDVFGVALGGDKLDFGRAAGAVVFKF